MRGSPFSISFIDTELGPVSLQSVWIRNLRVEAGVVAAAPAATAPASVLKADPSLLLTASS